MLATLVAALVLSQIAPVQASALPQVQPALLGDVRSYIPQTARDISFVVSTDHGVRMTFVAWCTRLGDEPGFDGTVIAVRGTGKRVELVWKMRLPGEYSPNLTVKSEFQYHGHPVVILRTQFGAAAAELRAIGVAGGRIHSLDSLDADDFEYVALADTTYLMAHDDTSLLDIPHLYRWTGTYFVDDSANHPDYYRELAARIRNKSDVSSFAAPVRDRYGLILRLSGEGPQSPPDSCASTGSGNCCVELRFGKCFSVRGRYGIYLENNGIWAASQKRLLPTAGDGELDQMIRDRGSWEDYDLVGDFTLCPLSRYVHGHRQSVCVQSWRNIKVVKRLVDH